MVNGEERKNKATSSELYDTHAPPFSVIGVFQSESPRTENYIRGELTSNPALKKSFTVNRITARDILQ